MKKSTLLMIVSVVLALTLSLGSTLAYLQDSDSDVNVMTLGSVYIEQIEQEWDADKNELKEFTQEKPLFPYVGDVKWENEDEANGAYRRFTMSNAVDKYVSVKNTGKSPAYVRTIIAFEMGKMDWAEFDKFVGISNNVENGSSFQFPGAWKWEMPQTPVVIDGNNYIVWTATHQDPVAPGATTIPSLLQVYLDKTAGNEEVEKLDGNGNGYYDILTLSQAVQTAGFDKAETALDTAFGKVADKVAEWMGGQTPPITQEKADTTWYTENTEATTYTLYSAEELAGLSQLVWNGNNMDGKTIKLGTDINLFGAEWQPIGRMINTSGTGENSTFKGNFDGQGHTVSNFVVNTVDEISDSDKGAGLFGAITGNISNLTVENVTIDTNHWAGAIAGSIEGSITNCHVKNATITCLPEDLAAKTRSADWDNGDKAGAIVGYATKGEIENCSAENVKITVYREGGAIVGCSYNNVVNCSAKDVTLIKDDTHDYKGTDDDGTVGGLMGKAYGGATVTDSTSEGMEKGIAATAASKDDLQNVLKNAAKDEEVTNVVVDAAGAEMNMNYGVSKGTVPAGTTVTIANANVMGKSYGNAVDGTVIFENCTFENANGAYSIHFDDGSGDVVFKNCTLSGWCSFGSAIQSVTMENCTIKGNGIYAMSRFYQPATLTNCTIECSNAPHDDGYPDGISIVENATVTMNGCTVKYADWEVADGGKIVVDGVTVAENADYEFIKNENR